MTARLSPVRRLLLLTLGTGLCTLATTARAEDRGWWSEQVGGGLVRGSGHVVSQPRSVTPFQAVHLKGSMNLVLRPGAKEAVEVRADDNLLALVETAVTERDGVPTLEIGSRQGASYSTHNRIVVTVDVVTLKALAMSGSGDAMADGLKATDLKIAVRGSGDLQLRQFKADALTLTVSGSGDVGASGRVTRMSLSIAGSGDVSARELEADDVSINISGSGDASVNARKLLSVAIAGSGDVDYVGDAAVRSSVAGSGSVRRR